MDKMDKTDKTTKIKPVMNLTLAAMFLAVGLLLPFLTGQIKQIGNMLLPMHIPVIMCGLICGWKYGFGVGFVMPLMRSMLFGRPIMYPDAIAMAFERRVVVFAFALEMHCFALPQYDNSDDRGACCVGDSGGLPAWSRRERLYMADVYRGRVY